MIPDAATSPVLIFVGYSMISSIKNIDFGDFSEAFGPFVMIIFTAFAGGVAAGISAGILADVAVKTFSKTAGSREYFINKKPGGKINNEKNSYTRSS